MEDLRRIDPELYPVSRFDEARDEADNILSRGKARVHGLSIRSTLQRVAVIILAVIPAIVLIAMLVFSIIDNPILDVTNFKLEGIIWILGIIIAAIIFFESDSEGCLVPLIGGAIGGALADENSKIKLDSGNVEIIVNGSKVVGIGSIQGYTQIIVNQSHVAISASGADAVGIGSMEGRVEINTSADIELEASGSRATGIGVLQYGKGRIYINSGFVSCNVHSMSGMGIGSLDGDMDIRSSARSQVDFPLSETEPYSVTM